MAQKKPDAAAPAPRARLEVEFQQPHLLGPLFGEFDRNLVAIEEYEETEQRYNFLNAQHDDLVKAKEQLVEILTKINGQTKEMFAETFAKIRENFRNTFTVPEAIELVAGVQVTAYKDDSDPIFPVNDATTTITGLYADIRPTILFTVVTSTIGGLQLFAEPAPGIPYGVSQ